MFIRVNVDGAHDIVADDGRIIVQRNVRVEYQSPAYNLSPACSHLEDDDYDRDIFVYDPQYAPELPCDECGNYGHDCMCSN